jgi:hypothetical protein
VAVLRIQLDYLTFCQVRLQLILCCALLCLVEPHPTDYLLRLSLSDETPANYSRYVLFSTMSGGTTLQPLYLAELPYQAILDYNRVSAAHLT